MWRSITSSGTWSTRYWPIGASPEGSVILRSGFGGERILDTLVGEQLPRIC
jgi:hydrogenase expression/formation protein HypE